MIHVNKSLGARHITVATVTDEKTPLEAKQKEDHKNEGKKGPVKYPNGSVSMSDSSNSTVSPRVGGEKPTKGPVVDADDEDDGPRKAAMAVIAAASEAVAEKVSRPSG